MDRDGSWPELAEAIPRAIAVRAAGRVAERLAGLPTAASDGDDLIRLATLDFERRLPQNLRDSRAVARARAASVLTMLRGEALAELVLRAEWAAVRRVAQWLIGTTYLRGHEAISCIEGSPLVPLLCDEKRLDRLTRHAGSDAADFSRSPAFVELATRTVRARHEAELEALVAEHEEERRAAREIARLAPPWEQKRPSFERPAPIHPSRPPRPRRTPPFSRPYPRGAA